MLILLSGMKEKHAQLLKQVETAQKPVVFINACTHGHEKVGVKIIEALAGMELKQGTIITNIANERAYEANVQFTESDLNRVFPGKQNGTYEERLAHELHPIIQTVDVCIDIHSTSTMLPGAGSALITTKLDEPTLALIEAARPPRVFVMNVTRSNALISAAPIGIGFEYGKDDDLKTYEYMLRDIMKMLRELDMIDEMVDDTGWETQTCYYDVYGTLPKDGLDLTCTCENFTTVPAGTLLGTRNGESVYATEDFVPLLFGQNRYKNIYGFLAKEILPHSERPN